MVKVVRWLGVCLWVAVGGCYDGDGQRDVGTGASGGTGGTAGAGGKGGGAGKGGTAGTAGGALTGCPAPGAPTNGPCSVRPDLVCDGGFVDCCMPITHGFPLRKMCVDGMWKDVTVDMCHACPPIGSGGMGGGQGGATSQAGEGGDGGEGLVSSAGAAGEGGSP